MSLSYEDHYDKVLGKVGCRKCDFIAKFASPSEKDIELMKEHLRERCRTDPEFAERLGIEINE